MMIIAVGQKGGKMKELIVKENKFPIRADGLEICYDTQYKIIGEIIRCKDCKHWRGHCLRGNDGKPDWYCADGERKDT